MKIFIFTLGLVLLAAPALAADMTGKIEVGDNGKYSFCLAANDDAGLHVSVTSGYVYDTAALARTAMKAASKKVRQMSSDFTNLIITFNKWTATNDSIAPAEE